MLKLLPQYEDAVIKRTRDQVVLDTCDIVVDVGGIYDPAKHRYDHHQRLVFLSFLQIHKPVVPNYTFFFYLIIFFRTFQESFSTIKPEFPFVTRLSSAGLVYLHFGEKILSQVMTMPKDSELVQQTYKKVYQGFIEEIVI